MDRRRQAQHRAGVHLTIPGVDAAILAVQRGQQRAAHLGDHQHTLGGDGAHHQAQGIHMGAKAHLAAGFPTGHRDDQIALVGAPGGKALFPGNVFRHRHYLFGKAGGAVLPQQFLERILQERLAGFPHRFLCHIFHPFFVAHFLIPSYIKTLPLTRGTAKRAYPLPGAPQHHKNHLDGISHNSRRIGVHKELYPHNAVPPLIDKPPQKRI